MKVYIRTKYGKSWWNSENQLFGCKYFSTEYTDEIELGNATRAKYQGEYINVE